MTLGCQIVPFSFWVLPTRISLCANSQLDWITFFLVEGLDGGVVTGWFLDFVILIFGFAAPNLVFAPILSLI